MWKLSIEDDQSQRTVVSLVRGEYSLGRAEHNAIRLTERNVSRRHAVLTRLDEGWKLRDLGSYTGCFVNEQRVEEDSVLQHGARLRLGDYYLVLTDSTLGEETLDRPSDAAARATIGAKRPQLDQDRLIVVSGPGEGSEYALGAKRMLIGRGDECDISLPDSSVSRIHIDIERMPGGSYRVEDQDSSNGLFINDRELPSATLSPGDVIELGDVRLVFVAKGEQYRPSKYPTPLASLRAANRWFAEGRRNVLLLVLAVSGGLILGTAFFKLSRNSTPKVHTAATEKKSPSTIAVEQAVLRMKEGDIAGAHRALDGVNSASNLTQSEVYREIETLWADQQFAAATQTTDPAERRRILGEIASSPGVDSLRRRRAVEALDAQSKTNVSPTDLPEAAGEDLQ